MVKYASECYGCQLPKTGLEGCETDGLGFIFDFILINTAPITMLLTVLSRG